MTPRPAPKPAPRAAPPRLGHARKRAAAAAATHRPFDDIPIDLPVVSAAERARALRLADALAAAYPDAHCELNYRSPHELLVATILSAQTTDVGVNKATPALFAQYPTPADYARATPAEIEPLVRTLGFFRNKARAVHAAMKDVHERFGGRVPRSIDDLLTLRGVARKTANVVLGNAYGLNMGFVVDTHVERLAQRFALAPRGSNVATIEKRLMALFPRDRWCTLSHQLIWHGRRACKARHVTCTHPVCAEFGDACECRGVKSKTTAGTGVAVVKTEPGAASKKTSGPSVAKVTRATTRPSPPRSPKTNKPRRG
jgi:endonuclease-3